MKTTTFTATSNDRSIQIEAPAEQGVVDSLAMQLVDRLGLFGRVDVKLASVPGNNPIRWSVVVDGVRCGTIIR